MLIFNQGKYKSILAAQTGELEAIQKIVETDENFRPVYHLAPPTGLLNDPNGLVFDGEKYHLFYQWFPFDAIHGMKHWKHFTTKDFLTYKSADDLIPNELFESHGCYSGGAIKIGKKLAIFYTGNTRRAEDHQRIPYQNLALFDLNGKLLSKRPLIKQAPEGYTEHTRDPKPYLTPEGKIRFVCGAQRKNLTGTAIVFEMDNLDSDPRLIGELSISNFDNQSVFMWECPDLFRLGNKDIFIWSPQGKPQETFQFQNNYHAVYAIGTLSELTFNTQHFAELDQGFDFYAPQTFSGLNHQSETIMFGWIGLPDLTYPTDQYKWHSALTMPRSLRIEEECLKQRPIAKIYASMEGWHNITLAQQTNINNLDRAYIHFENNNEPFNLNFFNNEKGQQLILSYDGKVLCLDRRKTEQTELMENFGGRRYCEIDTLNEIEIFFDRSIIEIFINKGQKTMTSRFFIKDREHIITADRSIQLDIAYPKIIE
ncbi:glycoside hydrolase family 32 protein [Rodentibacter caecimuris]|uniref:Sucrose-6-phosphate hydrolase n=1 Tax=Rodentibacter caecimuris TaxID=1796644 RepID=A0ABX3KWY3_9PAST|nr:fructosidase [Rodentibacter heylii]